MCCVLGLCYAHVSRQLTWPGLTYIATLCMTHSMGICPHNHERAVPTHKAHYQRSVDGTQNVHKPLYGAETVRNQTIPRLYLQHTKFAKFSTFFAEAESATKDRITPRGRIAKLPLSFSVLVEKNLLEWFPGHCGHFLCTQKWAPQLVFCSIFFVGHKTN